MTMHPYKYPIGPLSLVQLEYWKSSVKDAIRHGRLPAGTDPVTYANTRMPNSGIYPTFGHIDIRTRRWYRDLWSGRRQEIGIKVKVKG